MLRPTFMRDVLMTLPTTSCQQGQLLQTEPAQQKSPSVSSGFNPVVNGAFNQSDQNKFPENLPSIESERQFTTELDDGRQTVDDGFTLVSRC